MKARMRWIGLAACCAVPLLCSGAMAQAQEPAPASLAKAQVEYRVWSGKLEDGTKLREVPLSAAAAAEFRKELAQIQVAIEVDRDFQGALKGLNDLATRASRSGYANRLEVLVEVALARADVLEMLNSIPFAQLAATQVLPTTYQLPYEMVAANAEDLALAAKAAMDPRLVALNQRLEALSQRGGKKQATVPEVDLESLVKDAIRRGDDLLIRDLGPRAVPALKRLVLDSLGTLPTDRVDPLRSLVDLDSEGAAELMRLHFDDAGEIWKTRILRAINRANVFETTSRWIREGTRGKLSGSNWPALLERLIDEPSTQMDALPLVGRGLTWDGLTPGLQQQLVRLIAGQPFEPADAISGWLSLGVGNASVLPVAEAGLRSPHAGVRAAAAEQLQFWPASTALAAAWENPDPVLRAAAAAVLRPHSTKAWKLGLQPPETKVVEPVLGERERQVLMRLLGDSESEVRYQAAASLVVLKPAPEGDIYTRIAKDPQARVRMVLLGAEQAPMALRAQVATAAAGDADPETVARFDGFLHTVARDGGSKERLLELLPAIRARRANPVAKFDAHFPAMRDVVYPALGSLPRGLDAMITWSAEATDYKLAQEAVKQLSKLTEGRRGASYGFPRKQFKAAELNVQASPAELAGLFAACLKMGMGEAFQLSDSLTLWNEDLSGPFLTLAQDPTLGTRERLHALDVASNTPNDRTGRILLELISTDGASLSGGRQADQIASIASRLSAAEAKRLLDAVLADKRLSASPAAAAVAGCAFVQPLDAHSSDLVLERWLLSLADTGSTPELALQQVATRPRAAQGEWLVRALRESSWGAFALGEISDLRDPSYLPLLQEGLNGDVPFGNRNMDAASTRSSILNALTRYFNDEAADIILATAGSTGNAQLRSECFAALETIRKYQEEKGRWQGDRASRAATDAAIRDLLALLDDPTPLVRAQAVRGLATLRAVEQMPRVVRLLKDPDEGVRKAADEALGVLNTPPQKKE